MRRRRRRWGRWLLALVVVGVVWLVVANIRWPDNGPVQTVQATPEQIANGRRLADAADCAACHTATGGAPFAGGVALPTPFGVIHGTNITPDPDHGIGRYTADDFHHALTHGEARGGRQLYPAMPYPSYRRIARADSDAIYAYLMSQPAAAVPNPSNGVGFPFNIRTFVNFWNFLYRDAEGAPTSQGSSPAWQRGRYLVDVLGHCGDCHSPRGTLGQVDHARALTGNTSLGRFAAPAITPSALAARGWNTAELDAYFSRGIAGPAAASGEMATVVALSTSRLSDDDRAAMIAYLLGDAPPAARTPAVAATDASVEPGSRHYADLCAGCHGGEGQGVPHVAVALAHNSTVLDADAHNLVVTILDGLPEHVYAGGERMQAMPGSARELADADVAALANWLRVRWGDQPASVTAADVHLLRTAESITAH
jgi:mono/diheme cytochrome c family protein